MLEPSVPTNPINYLINPYFNFEQNLSYTAMLLTLASGEWWPCLMSRLLNDFTFLFFLLFSVILCTN